MSQQFSSGYALLIGVDGNAVPRLALPDVAKDVAALVQVLVHPQRCAYPQDNVKTITGEEATKAGIQAGLDWLYDRIQADESGNATAVIYFSGHGWQDTSTDPPTYYLVPFDMQMGRYRSRALPASEFAVAVDELNPRRLLVVLDCCHAAGMEVKALDGVLDTFHGAAVPPELFVSGEKAIAPAGAKSLSALAQGAGRAVLSSSQGTESSYVRKDRTMSIFTYHLIEALTGHAQPAGGGATEVLVSDVMGHVTRTVPVSTRQDWNESQTPDFRVTGNFPVAMLLGGKGIAKGERAPSPIDTPLAPAPASRSIVNTGSGAVAQGPGAVAAGAGGVAVGGNVQGGIRIGGDFVGRDKIVHGDVVHGDKVGGDKISVGDITGSQGVAIGRGASAEVHVTQGASVAELMPLFAPLLAEAARSNPATVPQVRSLQEAVAKGEEADDEQVATLIEQIADAAPSLVEGLINLFTNSVVAKAAGSVTKYVLKRLGKER